MHIALSSEAIKISRLYGSCINIIRYKGVKWSSHIYKYEIYTPRGILGIFVNLQYAKTEYLSDITQSHVMTMSKYHYTYVFKRILRLEILYTKCQNFML